MKTPTAADAAAHLEAHGQHALAAAVYRLMSDHAELRADRPSPKPTRRRTDAEIVADLYGRWKEHPGFPHARPNINDVRKVAGGGGSRGARIRDMVRKVHAG